ncbi:MAG: UDP-N-acetylglucosamine 2-epimerase (non-hydrolyzing) [Planctomycetes bacterium]|nr:UDP-N-acetylglucosamine 2-epimerase (non-hydrolyzing) [Planctomycetota bacterium]
MKAAPLVHRLRERGHDAPLIHTGQHYDANMSKVFFDDLRMPEPDEYLGVGSGSHAEQTARVMIETEKVFLARKPDVVVVLGDVNSTVACSLTATKLWIPVAHVEAGLRSRDRRMPEEINRIVTDSISDLLFTPSRDGDANLLAEGIDAAKIHFVGNIMIDSLVAHLERAGESDACERVGVEPGKFGVMTLHRPSNVDDPEVLRGILGAVAEVSNTLPIVFPCHPRTVSKLESDPGLVALMKSSSILRVEPLGYLDFLRLVSRSALVVTDSGGLQEETTYLKIPCVTTRENTERPITVDVGTNTIVGTDPGRILAAARAGIERGVGLGTIPELWDGRTADRIVDVLERSGSASG